MSTNAMWWLTLLLGLVVSLVAVLLLQIFYRKLRRIEAGSAAIWETGKQVARNTATTWMLQQTTVRLDALTDEALRHDAFLDGALADANANANAAKADANATPVGNVLADATTSSPSRDVPESRDA